MIGSGSRYNMTYKDSPANGGLLKYITSDTLDSLINALNITSNPYHSADCTDVKIIDTQHEVKLEFEEVKERILVYNVTGTYKSEIGHYMNLGEQEYLGSSQVKERLEIFFKNDSFNSVHIERAPHRDLEDVIEIKYKVKSND